MTAKHKLLPCLVLLAVLALGGWIWYDSTVDRSGWEQVEGHLRYKDFHGKYVSGWVETDKGQCYFHPNFNLATGWTEIDGKTYHFSENGVLSTGWVEGRYLGNDGTPLSGWLEENGARYYLNAEGAPYTGRARIGESDYLFQENGMLVTGWAELSGKRYYFTQAGPAATGWQQVEGLWYWFREDGTPYTGWLELDGSRYYFHSDGAAAQGPTEVDGQLLHFTPRGLPVVLVNPWNYMEESYRPLLTHAPDGHFVDKVCITALEAMLSDCAEAGHTPVIASSYREWSHQEYLFDRKTKFWLEEGYGFEEAQKKAGTSVAVPGTSEHQLGLAVDIVDSQYTNLDEAQADTATQKWLMEHCWEYGFILRYPIGTSEITGIIFEPWHYRYVGTEVSLELQRLGITLEEYLGDAPQS